MSIAAALAVVAIQANTASAQAESTSRPEAAFALTPLPASLVPDAQPAAEAGARISVRRVFVKAGVGMLAGAGAGLLIGAVMTDGCQDDESWCILGWEEEVAIHGVAGGMVGAGVGALYGLLSSPRAPNRQPAPVSVAPAAGGSVRVGLTLRH